MKNVTSGLDLRPSGSGMISEEGFIQVYEAFAGIWCLLSLSSIATNVINVKTFVVMGVADGVTVSFLCLSITDLCFSIGSFVVSISAIMIALELHHEVIFSIQPMGILMFASHLGILLCNITAMNTAFLAIARCMCVTRPLHFKDTFTKHRSIVIHLIFFFVAFSSYAPVLAQMGMVKNFDKTVNATRLVLWFSDIREKVKDIVLLIIVTVFSFVVQAIVVVCVVVLTISLRKAGKFRQSSQAVQAEDVKASAFKLSGKDLQVVKQVLLISVMYVLCSIPKNFIPIYTMTNAQFDVRRRLNNLYFTINYIRLGFELLNATTSLPVYYVYNGKFRTTFRSICKWETNNKNG